MLLKSIYYKKTKNECNYIRQLREDIDKYKDIVEKTNKACEEYSKEILKIKNIIEKNENTNNDINIQISFNKYY